MPMILDPPSLINIMWNWLDGFTQREHVKLVFITLYDTTGLTQAAIRKQKVAKNKIKRAKNGTLEPSAAINSTIHTDLKASEGDEIYYSNFEIISLTAEDCSIKKNASEVFLLDNRHLHIRSPKASIILRVKPVFCHEIQKWMNKYGFLEMFCPILITTAC